MIYLTRRDYYKVIEKAVGMNIEMDKALPSILSKLNTEISMSDDHS